MDAVDTVLAIEDIDETLTAGDIVPVRSPSSYEGWASTVRSWMALLEDRPAKGKVLLRTIFLMLLRVKLELLFFIELCRAIELKAPGGGPEEIDQHGESAFTGS